MREILERFEKTCRSGAFGAPKIPGGYFAQVLDLGGIGLAVTTDGVGTKAIVSGMMGRFESIGMDLVTLNCNDLLCVGAKPAALLDYIALEMKDKKILNALVRGICMGANWAGVSIPGGETAILGRMIQGVEPGKGFDLAATAIGTVPLDRIIKGDNLEPGDVLIGLPSTGIHNNGLTLARKVLFEQCGYNVNTRLSDLPLPLGLELLRTTALYQYEVLRLFDVGIRPKALVHISGGGLLNLTRTMTPDTGFEITTPLPVPALFQIIQKKGRLSDEEMFTEFNMGMGFCVVASPKDEEHVLAILRKVSEKPAQKIGHVVQDPERRIFVRPRGLVLKGDKLDLA